MAYQLHRHDAVGCPDLGDLIAQAEAEGHRFVARTADDWRAGTNRFDRVGETFILARAGLEVIGMCGLNRDPYLDDPAVGRLRHLYVHPAHRRAGLAAELVTRCLSSAPDHVERVRLRTTNPAADALYRSLGFLPVDDPTATHEWRPERE